MGNSGRSFPCPHSRRRSRPHNLFAANSNCCHRHSDETEDGSLKTNQPDISPESPADVMHHLVMTNLDVTPACGMTIDTGIRMTTSPNTGYSYGDKQDSPQRFYEITQTTLGCLRCSTLPRPPHAQRGPGSSPPAPGGRVCDELAPSARPSEGSTPLGADSSAGCTEPATSKEPGIPATG